MKSNELIEIYKVRLKEVLNESYDHLLKKAPDYEDQMHPIRTFRLSKDLNIEPWKGCLLRLGDKLSLLYTFVRDEKYTSHEEGFSETMLDVIVYAALASVLFEMKKELKNMPIDVLLEKIQKECLKDKND